MDVMELPLSQIRCDEKAQPRVKLDEFMVKEYSEEMSEGAAFPPVIVFHRPNEDYYLADGWHRIEAARRRGCESIMAEVHEGGLRDAILYSLSANTDHGLRRTRADKRRAVRSLLEDPEWFSWSDNEIATRCRVSRKLVASTRKAVREEKTHLVQEQDRTVKAMRGGKPYTVNASKIGRKASSSPGTCVVPQEEEASIAPIDALNTFRTLCASFSALPEPHLIANLIKKHGEDFSQRQAHKMVRWFDDLGICLAEGDNHWDRRGLLPPRSIHEVDYA
jgi:uncharacterized ParB-like nuclease family protein